MNKARKIITTFALGREQIAALDARADRQGITRSKVLRSILDDVVAEELDNPESICFPELIGTEQTQGFINPETPVRKLQQ